MNSKVSSKDYINPALFQAHLQFFDLYDMKNFDSVTKIEYLHAEEIEQMVIAIVMRRYITGKFGFAESRYYYLIHPIHKWSTHWADDDRANIPKEQKMRSLGAAITLELISKIYRHAEKRMELSTIVLPFKTEIGDKYSFRYLILSELEKYIKKFGPIYKYEYPDELNKEPRSFVGIPQHITTLDDPFL